MPVTLDDLKGLLVLSGVSRQTADGIDPDAPLSRQGVDSIAHPLFILTIEDQLGVRIDDELAFALRTLNDVLSVLNGAAVGKAGGSRP